MRKNKVRFTKAVSMQRLSLYVLVVHYYIVLQCSSMFYMVFRYVVCKTFQV